MSETFSIVVVARDRSLVEELESALRNLTGPMPVVAACGDWNEGVEAARNRAPQLVLVELTSDPRGLDAFAKEILHVSPASTLVAAMRRDAFDEQISESELLILAMRSGIRDFLRRPLSTAELSATLARIGPEESAVDRKRGHIIAFLSNKGGVGKSTLAVNTAFGLSRRYPGEVLLIDASLQMGVCASLLDMQPETTLTDAVEQRDRLDSTLLRQLAVEHPSGLHLLAAPANAIEAARVRDDDFSRIVSVARRTYDYVVIDTFPVIDSVVVSVLDFSQRGYIVLENVLPTLLGGIKLLDVLGSLGFPAERQRIVLNRETRVAGSLNRREIAERLGRSLNHALPYDKQVMVAANTGVPIFASASRLSGFKRGIGAIVSEIERDFPPMRPNSNGRAPRTSSLSVGESR